MERAQAALRSARAQLTVARRGADVAEAAALAAAAEVERAKAGLAEAEAAVADLTLESPIAGIVASIATAVGETASPGAPIVRIADTSE